MRTGSTIAELLVVLCVVGLALCMFTPTPEEAAGYTLDIIITGGFWHECRQFVF